MFFQGLRPEGQNGRIAILHSEAVRRAQHMDVLSDLAATCGDPMKKA